MKRSKRNEEWIEQDWIKGVCAFLFFLILLTVLFLFTSQAQADTVRGYANLEACERDVKDEKSGRTPYRYQEEETKGEKFFIAGSSLDFYSLDGTCYEVDQNMRRIANINTSINWVALEVGVGLVTTGGAKVIFAIKETATAVFSWIGARALGEGLARINDVPSAIDITIDIAEFSTGQIWTDPCIALTSTTITGGGFGAGWGSAQYVDCQKIYPPNKNLDPSQRIPASRPGKKTVSEILADLDSVTREEWDALTDAERQEVIDAIEALIADSAASDYLESGTTSNVARLRTLLDYFRRLNEGVDDDG